jgi:hypothetical protein
MTPSAKTAHKTGLMTDGRSTHERTSAPDDARRQTAASFPDPLLVTLGRLFPSGVRNYAGLSSVLRTRATLERASAIKAMMERQTRQRELYSQAHT